jgi:hypothetical protein
MEEICTICCGSKREVEIDCPSSCSYLRSGREYESARRLQDKTPPAFSSHWEEDFLKKHGPVFAAMYRIIVMVRREYPELIDGDARAALEALRKTYETEEKGIFYDFKPNSLLQRKLYDPLKKFLENPAGSEDANRPRLFTGETISCLDFILEVVKSFELPRPKSRAFLDSIEEHFGKDLPASRNSSLLLP